MHAGFSRAFTDIVLLNDWYVRSIKVGVADVRRKKKAWRSEVGSTNMSLQGVHAFSFFFCFSHPHAWTFARSPETLFFSARLSARLLRSVSCRVVSRVEFSLFSWFHDPSWCFPSDILGLFLEKANFFFFPPVHPVACACWVLPDLH